MVPSFKMRFVACKSFILCFSSCNWIMRYDGYSEGKTVLDEIKIIKHNGSLKIRNWKTN